MNKTQAKIIDISEKLGVWRTVSIADLPRIAEQDRTYFERLETVWSAETKRRAVILDRNKYNSRDMFLSGLWAEDYYREGVMMTAFAKEVIEVFGDE